MTVGSTPSTAPVSTYGHSPGTRTLNPVPTTSAITNPRLTFSRSQLRRGCGEFLPSIRRRDHPRPPDALRTLFVSIKGHPYARFKRSLEIGKLPIVLAAAAELPPLTLEDALDAADADGRTEPARPLCSRGGPLSGTESRRPQRGCFPLDARSSLFEDGVIRYCVLASRRRQVTRGRGPWRIRRRRRERLRTCPQRDMQQE